MTKPDEVTPLAEIEAVASDKLEQLLAVLVSQNRQPCMSGDMRDRLSSMQRRQVSDAALDIMEELITPLHVALHQAEARRASNAEMLAALREAEEARDVFIELNRIGSENAEAVREERDAALASLDAERAKGERMREALEAYNRHMYFQYEGLTNQRLHQTDATVWDKVINALAFNDAERPFQPCKPGEECSDEGSQHCRCARVAKAEAGRHE